MQGFVRRWVANEYNDAACFSKPKEYNGVRWKVNARSSSALYTLSYSRFRTKTQVREKRRNYSSRPHGAQIHVRNYCEGYPKFNLPSHQRTCMDLRDIALSPKNMHGGLNKYSLTRVKPAFATYESNWFFVSSNDADALDSFPHVRPCVRCVWRRVCDPSPRDRIYMFKTIQALNLLIPIPKGHVV